MDYTHRLVVGEAADHQDLFARAQIFTQRRGQALQQFAALRLQLVGVEREQHAATDADAAIDHCHPAGGQRCRQCLLQRLELGGLLLALLYLLIQAVVQQQLDADHTGQYQHEGAQQHRHQVAERGPGGGTGFGVEFDFVAHRAQAPALSRATASCCSSPMICFCESMLRSTTSRAWAT